MSYSPFEGFDSASKLLTSKIRSALYYIDKALQSIVLPTVEDIPLLSIDTNNVLHDGYGNISVEVSELNDQVQLGTVSLRDNSGILETSTDGENWEPVVSDIDASDVSANTAHRNDLNNPHGVIVPATTTDLPEGDNLYYTDARVSAHADVMLKSAYDPNANGVVEYANTATALNDGVLSTTTAEIVAHLEDTDIHGGGGGGTSRAVMDVAGNYYIPDGVEHHVLEVEVNGSIMLPSAIDAPNADIYIVVTSNLASYLGVLTNYGTTGLLFLHNDSSAISQNTSSKGDYIHLVALSGSWAVLDYRGGWNY